MHVGHETLERHVGGWRKIGHFSLLEEFVLRNGRPFIGAKYEGKRGTPKMCFQNAFELHARKPELLYVEGYAVRPSLGLPIHHAWLADPITHYVVDPTWDEPEACSYYGVAFKRSEVLEQVLKYEVYGILDPGLANIDLMLARDPTLRTLMEAACPPSAKPSARSKRSSSRSAKKSASR